MNRFVQKAACIAVATGAGGGLNLAMGWLDRPAALVGILVSGLVYLLALLVVRDLGAWRVSGSKRKKRGRETSE